MNLLERSSRKFVDRLYAENEIPEEWKEEAYARAYEAAKEKLALNSGALLLEIAAFAMLFLVGGWLLALAIFLFAWGRNLGRKAREI